MKLALACTLALALAPFALPPASADGDCVTYAYIPDYHWYYVCADAKDPSCVVSTKEQHGNRVTEECYGVDVALDAEPICTEYIGDLDHRWRYCVSGSPKCLVYQETQAGARTCLP